MEPDNVSESSNASARSITINEVTSEPEPAVVASFLSMAQPQSELDTPRKQRHKRLRRLANDVEIENGSKQGKPAGSYIRRLALGMFVSTLSIALLLGQFQYSPQGRFVQHFISSYRKHYNHIVHGRVDYCSLQLDTQTLFARIRQQPPQLLNQEHALQQLELALRNDSDSESFKAVAVVGPVGVGKSLWARALEQHFPWRENVHTYAWNTFVREETEKFRVVRMFAESLSDCGLNLLVIENLAPCDAEVVNIVNRLIAEDGEAAANGDTSPFANKRVLVIYIFNLNTMAPSAEQQRHQALLQQLPRTQTVNFRPFGAKELADCIVLEAANEDLQLSDEDFAAIVASIDATRSGCKNVHAKVLAYGTNAPKS